MAGRRMRAVLADPKLMVLVGSAADGRWRRRPVEDGPMTELIVVLAALVVFEVAAWRWGANSTDLMSDEWQRRRDWPGFRR